MERIEQEVRGMLLQHTEGPNGFGPYGFICIMHGLDQGQKRGASYLAAQLMGGTGSNIPGGITQRLEEQLDGSFFFPGADCANYRGSHGLIFVIESLL